MESDDNKPKEKLINMELGMSIIVLLAVISMGSSNTKIMIVLIIIMVVLLIVMLIPKQAFKRLMHK